MKKKNKTTFGGYLVYAMVSIFFIVSLAKTCNKKGSYNGYHSSDAEMNVIR